MPETADNVAADYDVSRADQDAFAARSQARWAAANEAGVLPRRSRRSVPQRKGDPVVVDTDEHPRPGTTRKKLAGSRASTAPI